MELLNVSPTQHKVFSCEQRKEAWQEDHARAKQLYKFEDLLGDVVECYDELHRFDEMIFENVQQGIAEYDEELDDVIVDLSGRIHELLRFLADRLIPSFQRDFDEVDNADAVKQRLARADESKKFNYRQNAHRSNVAAADRISASLGL